MNIDNNTISIRFFTRNLSDFITEDQFILKEVRKKYKYENGQRTDTPIGYTLKCAVPDTYDLITVTVSLAFVISEDDIEAVNEHLLEEPLIVRLPIKETSVYPYEVKYGKATVRIDAPKAEIVRV